MTVQPDRPNLFRHAMRELHQDAVLAWLLEWTAPRHKDVDPDLHAMAKGVVEALLSRHHLVGDAKVVDVIEVKSQWAKIDVFARLVLDDGRTVALVIENKTTSTRHSDQLK